VVRQAAATADKTLTDFVVGAALIEAERVLADRTVVREHLALVAGTLAEEPVELR
jgi:uncharacterized protein (DUF1778 family)